MVNRPKQIGTAAETAVLLVLLSHFPEARRNVQHGSRDRGDIFTRNICWEVKGGKEARGNLGGSLTPGILEKWMMQTEAETINAGARIGVLVTQRAGYGLPRASQWWAYLSAGDFGTILGATGHQQSAPVRLKLDELLSLLADCGWAPDAP